MGLTAKARALAGPLPASIGGLPSGAPNVHTHSLLLQARVYATNAVQLGPCGWLGLAWLQSVSQPTVGFAGAGAKAVMLRTDVYCGRSSLAAKHNG